MFNRKTKARERLCKTLERMEEKLDSITPKLLHLIESRLSDINTVLKEICETTAAPAHGVSCFNPPLKISIATDIEAFKSMERMGETALLLALDFRSGEKWPLGWVQYEDGKLGYLSPDLFRFVGNVGYLITTEE